MSAKKSKFNRWPLPADPFPDGNKCFQVLIPNEPQYIAVFKGQLWEMCRAYNWENDADHTAIAVADTMRDSYNDLVERDLCPGIPQWFMHIDPEGENSDVVLYDAAGEDDITFKVKAWAAFGLPDPLQRRARFSFDFRTYEDNLSVGVRFVNLFIQAVPQSGAGGIVIEWIDCLDDTHTETLDVEHVLKINWPNDTNGIGVKHMNISGDFAVSIFATAYAAALCLPS